MTLDAANTTNGSPVEDRVPKAQRTRQKLLQAALSIVAKSGYGAATVAAVTKRAKVSHGTFYNHFDNVQEIHDALPPIWGDMVLDHLRKRMPPQLEGLEREMFGFSCFFEFFVENRWGARLMSEAPIFAPLGYERYFRTIIDNYTRSLSVSVQRGKIRNLTEPELRIIAHMLISVRTGFAQEYLKAARNGQPIPASLTETYRKAVTRLLFDQ